MLEEVFVSCAFETVSPGDWYEASGKFKPAPLIEGARPFLVLVGIEGKLVEYTGEAGKDVERKGLLSVIISPGFSGATSERSEAADFFLTNGPEAKILLLSVNKKAGIPLVSLSLSFLLGPGMTRPEPGVPGVPSVCFGCGPRPYADTLLGVAGVKSSELSGFCVDRRSLTVTERLKLRLFLSDIPLGMRKRLRESGAAMDPCGDPMSLAASPSTSARGLDEIDALSTGVTGASDRLLPNPETNFVFFRRGRSTDEAAVVEAAGATSALDWVPFLFSDFLLPFRPPKAMTKSWQS